MEITYIKNIDKKIISCIRILHTIYAFVGLILLIDFLGAIAWMWSGQYPDGVFYVGTITIHILKFFIH